MPIPTSLTRGTTFVICFKTVVHDIAVLGCLKKNQRHIQKVHA
jgi:hypothetical protein